MSAGAAAAATAQSPADYDLTRTISPYLDRHLVIPLIDFLLGRKVRETR